MTEVSGVFGRNRTATEIHMKLAILRDNQLADFRLETPPRGNKPIERWYALRYVPNS